MLRQRRLGSVNCGADGGRDLELMGLANHEVLTVLAGLQTAGRSMVDVVFIKPAQEPTGIAIDNHSRSSRKVLTRSVFTRGPSIGTSFSSLSRAAVMLLALRSTLLSSKSFPLFFSIRTDSPGPSRSSGAPRRRSRPVIVFWAAPLMSVMIVLTEPPFKPLLPLFQRS